MTFNPTVLSRSLRYALSLGAIGTLGLTGTAIAQNSDDDDVTRMEAMVVTGNLVRRVDAETASPVFTLDREQIEATGAVTIGQFLQDSPNIAGAATNPQVNNGGGTGAATISLRGLGSNRTLLLVNGRRMVTADVNSIPINLVERIDILKDGASALYGSDAIGGVVNFILRRDFEGVEFSGTYGKSDRDDADLESVQITLGTTSDEGSLVMGFTYDNRELVSSGDRPFSKEPFGLYYGEQISVGSSRVPNGRYVIPRTVAAANGINCAGTGSTVAVIRIDGASGSSPTDFRCFIGGGPGNDTFNFQTDNVNLTPQERKSFFAMGDYNLSDSVRFFAEAYYHTTTSNFQIAPEPFDGRPAFANAPISADNIYNPFGVDITDSRLRLVNVGNRVQAFDTDRFQTSMGFDGEFGEGWRWSTSYTWGKTTQNSRRSGEIFTGGLIPALGPSFRDANGVPRCGTPGNVIAGCTPINFFAPAGAPGNTLAELGPIAPENKNYFEQLLEVYEAKVDGPIFEMPAGDLLLGLGVAYREESSDFRPDFLQLDPDNDGVCFMSGGCTNPVSGEFDVTELYFESVVPILADVPGAYSLNVILGGRYSDYSTFGDTTNFRVGIEWRPLEDLLIRANYAEVFRAPNISELFAGTANSASSFTDPCNRITVAGNPACQNVPTDGNYVQTDTQLPATVGSNPDTLAETGDTLSFGFVYDPSWFEGSSFSVDYYDVNLDDTIGALGTQNILDQCFNFGRFCNRFTRNSAGEINSLFDTTGNIGSVETQGIDFSFKYRLPETQWGSFRFTFDSTYLIKWNNEQIAGDPSTLIEAAGNFQDSSAGGNGHFTRWRALSAVDWNLGSWGAGISARYIGHVEENPNDFGGSCAECIANGSVQRRDIGSQTILDIYGSYAVEPINTTFTVGVDNVNDRLAPLIYSGFNGTTDVRTYDTIGRFYYLRATVKF